MCSVNGSASQIPAVSPAPGSKRLAVRVIAGPSGSCGSSATSAGSSLTIPLISRLLGTAHQARDRVATIVEDPLEVAPDERSAGDLTERTQRHAVDDEVADQRPAVPALERVRVLPHAERAADLAVGEAPPGDPGVDASVPAARHAVEREAVVDERAFAHLDGPRREDPEAQPGWGDRLEVEGVREEIEGLAHRPRHELSPLDRVQSASRH